MQQPIYQHNWTGALALYVTSPAQPLLDPAIVKGVSHNTKVSKGTWLKAASHARLRLVEHEEQHEGQNSITSMLELHLQENLLLQCPLLEQHLSLCIIPSSSTANSGSILVLRTKQQQEQQQQQVGCQRMHAVVGVSATYVACTASVCIYRCVPVYMMLSNCKAAASCYHRPCCGCIQPCLPSQQPHLLPHRCNVCGTSCAGGCFLCLLHQQHTAGAAAAAVLQAPVWCFRFYDAPDCSSFKSALQAMLSSMHSRSLQQQREQQQRHQQMLQQTLQQQQQQQEEVAAMTGPTSAQPQVSIAQHACCLLSCCLVTNSRQQHTIIPSSYTTS
jgi:hypothetical protein